MKFGVFCGIARGCLTQRFDSTVDALYGTARRWELESLASLSRILSPE